MGGAACKVVICSSDAAQLGENSTVYLESAYFDYLAENINQSIVSKGQFLYNYMTGECGLLREDIETSINNQAPLINRLQGFLTTLQMPFTSITPDNPSNTDSALIPQWQGYDLHINYLSHLFYSVVRSLADGYVKNMSVADDIDVFLTVLDSAGITNGDLVSAGGEADALEVSNEVLREAIVNY